MAWRLAKSLGVLRDQINALSPNRSKASDGTIGNAEHSARTSDHNPNDAGVVCAIDITNDPAHGIDSEQFAEMLRASRDIRIKYIISNKKIANAGATGGKPAWAWRPYTGKNPHDHHVHVSVKSDKADATQAWALALQPSAVPPSPAEKELPTLRLGDKDYLAVMEMQTRLNKHGEKLTVDGVFGAKTVAAVKKFQKKHKLVADGVVGSYTWKALEA